MMRQKLLHELLDEDQEPFFIGTIIKKNQNQLQIKKPKPISQPTRLAGNLCKNSCFFTLPESPDPKKSPICFSVHRSPKSPNNIFLHVPAKTASLLLEAAMKIQKNSAAAKRTTKQRRFGLFGSLLKRLTHISPRSGSSKTKKRSVESIAASSCRKTSGGDVSIRGIYGNHDSSDWNVEILSDGDDLVGVDEIDLMIRDAEFDFCHESPFRFVLQRSPPRSCPQTPNLPSSPATSPIRHQFEQLGRNNISTDTESLKKLTSDEDEEQFSPVCVLDPPFEDDEDDEAHQHEHHGANKDEAFDYECSYAIVQRAKQQLLKKLYRFEKLAGLDPNELEKRMLEEQDSSDEDSASANETDRYYKEPNNGVSSVTQVLESSFHHPNNVPDGMKKLVTDLVAEEERMQRDLKNRDMVARGVCSRLETWKEVDLDTIDMMVDHDMRRNEEGWVRRPDQEQVAEAAAEIEVAIFGVMVEELVASI